MEGTPEASSSVQDTPAYEVSVVGSPEVFGASSSSNESKDGSPEGEVRPIERCDVTPPQMKVEPKSEPLETERPRPHSQLPNIVPVGEAFVHALSQWEWVSIDGIQLPAVTRGGEKYVAVHMVQLKLLSRFPPGIPTDILTKFTMVSHKMTVTEVWLFNSINAVIRRFDLGCQLFNTNDELVLLHDTKVFYWNVKVIHLDRLRGQYEKEMAQTANLTLMATIMELRKHVETDIVSVNLELKRLQEEKRPSPAASDDKHSLTHSSPASVGEKQEINVYS